MVLTLYKLDPSPPVRAVYMTLEALNITDVEYVDVNLFEGEHFRDEFLEVFMSLSKRKSTINKELFIRNNNYTIFCNTVQLKIFDVYNIQIIY